MIGSWGGCPWGANLAYMIAVILFMAGLRGLSGREFRRTANRLGMAGMALAVCTTLYIHNAAALPEILIALAIGGGLGLVVARRVVATAIPQILLVFEGLAGLSVMLVAIAVHLDPDSFDNIGSRVWGMAFGTAFGAVSVGGALVALLKRVGIVPEMPVRRAVSLMTLVAMAGAIVWFCTLATSGETPWLFCTVVALGLLFGSMVVLPVADADLAVVQSLLASCLGWAALALGVVLQNIAMILAGALVGSSGAILIYRLCKTMNRPLLLVLAGNPGSEVEKTFLATP